MKRFLYLANQQDQIKPNQQNFPLLGFGTARKVLTLATLVASSCALGPAAMAQTTAQTAIPSLTSSTNEQRVNLNPFIVSAQGDSGYQAASTLSGTRFRTSLADTAASISVYTKAFINDMQIENVEELARYSMSDVIDTDDAGDLGGLQTTQASAVYTVPRIRIRGLQSSQGMDYFKRIIPSDGYNIGRYDEDRGPNGILFGVSQAGGITNTSSVFADTRENSGQARLVMQSTGGLREEFRYNDALVPGKVGVVMALVNQKYRGWKDWDWNDARRGYFAATWRVNSHLTLRANAQSGQLNYSTAQVSTLHSDGAMVYTDWVNALGGDSSLLFAPNNSNPTAAEKARGLGNSIGKANGNTYWWTYVPQDGGFYNEAGSYSYTEYGSAGVTGPNWTPPSFVTGTTGKAMNRPSLFPYTINITGPGQYHNEHIHSYEAFADIRVTNNLYFSLAANHQDIRMVAPNSGGQAFTITVDPNTTRGTPTLTNGNPNPGYGGVNPYAGYYAIQSEWRRDNNHSTYNSARLSMLYSYDFAKHPRWAFLGSHQIAFMVARSVNDYERWNQSIGFLGGAWSGNYNSRNNRIRERYYFKLPQASSDPASIHIPSWTLIPTSVTYNGTTYPVGWYDQPAGTQNAGYAERDDTYLGVIQSHFWKRRVVVTFGYRHDAVQDDKYGYTTDPMIGDVLDPNSITATNKFGGLTRTTGLVFHVFKDLDLIANRATNIGIPDARLTVLPDGGPPNPSHGVGKDLGIGFRLFNNRIQGRLIYYTTNSENLAAGGGNYADFNRIRTALGDALIAANVYTTDSWNAKMAALGLDKQWSGIQYNLKSKGAELQVIANLTPNWRLMFHASYTDRVQQDRNADVASYFGWTEDPNSPSRLQYYLNGITPQSDGTYAITNPGAYAAGGAYANFIALGQQLPAGQSLENLVVQGNGTTATEHMYNDLANINRNKEQNQRRMGLRPYKVNMFTAYDFTHGFLKGFSIGGGFAWEDHAVIGLYPDLTEVYNKPILQTNLMVRYRFKRDRGWLRGQWTAQINVDNVLNDHAAILQRLAIINDYMYNYQLPNGWGTAAGRWDTVQPINFRASITYDF